MRTLLLLFSLLLSLRAAAIEPPKATEKWSTLRVDEFELISNASASKTVAIAEELVRMRAAVGEVTRLKVRSPLPTKVFLFANERAFVPYRDALFGRKSTFAGVFVPREDANYILLRVDGEEGGARIVFHELTHYFIKNTVGNVPLWLNEALAEYYSTFRTFGSDVHIGRPIEHHVLWLRDQRLIPLEELFTVDHDSPIYNEGQRTGVFYAQSWALLHYLMLGNKQARRAQLSKFVALLGAGRPTGAAFAEAFNGLTYAQLGQELRSYVARRVFAYTTYPLRDLKVSEIPKPRPLTHGETLYEFGGLLARMNPSTTADAERFLTAALDSDAQKAVVYAELGRIHSRAGRNAEADAAFEKAVQVGTNDTRIYVEYGESILERIARGGAQPEAAALKARKLFERAVQLDPTSARALKQLGATYLMSSGDVTPGIAALEKSVALVPGDEQASFYLAQLYVHASRHADAARILEGPLARSSNPELSSHVRGMVVRMDEYEATQRAVEQFNQAIAKANAGKNAEALKMMDEVIPKITDPELLAQAKKLREELAKRVTKKRK